MNDKIVITVTIAFVIVFSAFFAFYDAFSDISSDIFYTQEFDPTKKKIFIYGSSHVVQLNTTHINFKISQIHSNFIIYNMGENADTPIRRSLNLQKDISLNPEIIFYGLAFRDLSLQNNEKQITDFKLNNILPSDFVEIETINPKLTTLQVLRSIVIDIFSEEPKKNIPYPNNPAFSDRVIEKISTDKELLKKFSPLHTNIQLENNKQLVYFKEILTRLKENDVKVVIFISPYHKFVLDSIPSEEKAKFFSILSSLEKEFDVKVYDFSEKYVHMEIWRDGTHVAYNPNSIIFSEDIAQIIIEEIEN